MNRKAVWLTKWGAIQLHNHRPSMLRRPQPLGLRNYEVAPEAGRGASKRHLVAAVATNDAELRVAAIILLFHV